MTSLSTKPEVFLNHFFLVVDSETYSDIRSSQFLKTQFAAFEERTTVRADRSYTGAYFYGTNTYFEFLDAASETKRSIGDTGLAFGVEQLGSLKLLNTMLPASLLVEVSRELNGEQVPWFLQLSPRGFGVDTPLASWLMEYHESFLDQWHAGKTDGSGIDRQQILDRYKSVLLSLPETPCLEDVMGLELALSNSDSDRLADLCTALGYTEKKEGDRVLKGAEFFIRIVPESKTSHGIRQVNFSLRRTPRGESEYRFGKESVLRFHNTGAATWSFGELANVSAEGSD